MGTWIAVAVPKRRGLGYLKVPAGHHEEAWIREAEDAAGGADIFGLDGYLEIAGWRTGDDRAVFAAMQPVLLREFRAVRVIEAPLEAVLNAHRRPNA